jgi:REP element-mobilizing transposase RayT
MNKPRFQNRITKRLPEFAYSRTGVYFITICTYNKAKIFGDIVKGEMIINKIGLIAQNCWAAIPNHFPNADLYDYIVMPDHVHGIIVLDKIDDNPNIEIINMADTACRVPTRTQNESFSNPTIDSIPTIIRSYKSAVTKLARETSSNHAKKFWQPRYYEHIIRTVEDLENIIDYIKTNPINREGTT